MAGFMNENSVLQSIYTPDNKKKQNCISDCISDFIKCIKD